MKIASIFAGVIIFYASCDRPKCVNTNPIFDKYLPADEEYKAELAKEIERIGKDNLSYWIESYIEQPTDTFMSLNVQDKELCAVMVMHISQCEKLEYYIRLKGAFYRGAELSGLKFDIVNNTQGTQFIYNDHNYIID